MAGELQDYTVDQAAGAIALTLGALGSLLLVIWQSRCLCRCRIGISDQCYLFEDRHLLLPFPHCNKLQL